MIEGFFSQRYYILGNDFLFVCSEELKAHEFFFIVILVVGFEFETS